MAIGFISDLHLCAQRPETTELFRRYLREQASAYESLYILGDLFEFWIGDDATHDPTYAEVEKELHQLSDSGVNLYFMPGNRDFLIGQDFAQRCGLELLADFHKIQLANETILLCHGDVLCTDDVAHQTARAFFLDPAWQKAFLQTDLEHRLYKAEMLREESEENKAGKTMSIMDVNNDAVASALKEHNCRIMIHGHTHRPAIHQLATNDNAAYRIVLGDWYEQSSELCYSNGKLSLSNIGELSLAN